MPEQHLSISNKIPTPFILVDEQVVKSNLRRIHGYAHRHGFSVRAHVKTHKSFALARMQMAMGAVGIAVAKAEEAEVMAGLGHMDITVGLSRRREGTDRENRPSRRNAPNRGRGRFGICHERA